MIRIITEDEETAAIREQLKVLDYKQLLYLEEIIKQEKRKRQEGIFSEWQGVLRTYLKEHADHKDI